MTKDVEVEALNPLLEDPFPVPGRGLKDCGHQLAVILRDIC